MNTKKMVWCCAAVALLMLSGCKPVYEKLIQGDWVVDRYYKNGSDQTAIWVALKYQITFHSDGAFTETTEIFGVTIPVTGTWLIEKKPDGKIGEFQLQLTDDVNGVRTFDIKKISKETIDIYRNLGDSDNEEFLLEPVPAT